MKIISVLFLMFSFNSYSCGIITGLFTTENISLDYAGTIKLGMPYNERNNTFIPLSFTGGKWLNNSGIVFKEVISKVEGFQINITVQTCLASGDSQNKTREIIVNKLVSGTYKVNYVNPNNAVIRLGEIKI
ncbi:hypothetical protein [uncultured Psychrosphaera sp.]|uniref:hypothetical protein n=1 Tax=uncultured Psychrosphaera sp. TaxID=1403522 RepID=UPI002606BD13|nr:hypothetical protein [uncultured Psychrosphaera sp.]